MKKLAKLLSIFIAIFCLCSCATIREYNGKKIVKLTYTTVDYLGGYTVNKVLDFVNNEYSTSAYTPDDGQAELQLKKVFSDSEEKSFIDGVYSSGLFDINENYEAEGIDDGGGWRLIIEYVDGTKKISNGSNASPTKIFNNCSTYFYDLCGEEVLGTLPNYYKNPPEISYSFHYKKGENNSVSDNSLAKVVRGNYKWNKAESLNNDLFALNEDIKERNDFLTTQQYDLVLYTANYSCEEKFNKITVKAYDYNKNLTNEKLVFEGEWIEQIELKIELNKIYVYKLSFKDGDFVEYTFNTNCN